MVSKYVLLISDQSSSTNETNEDLLQVNSFLHAILTKYKNKITDHYRNKLWDRYKKLTNEYEMIFTTPNTGNNISVYFPVSRSFFKMWEMIHDFSENLDLHLPKMHALFLAEGPGGFAEAMIKYRNNSHDNYYGISLKSANKNIPDWKYQDRLTISHGADGTGDLYKLENIHYLVKSYPKMHIITADGGFDFSADFNNQEELSLRLILCEIYAAFNVQAAKGHFILKIYDLFHEYTLKTICMLKQFYDSIYLVKPLSSRPANSEKYLVCTGFRGIINPNIISQLRALISNYTENTLEEFFNTIIYDQNVLHNLISHNIYYTLRQVYYIEQTIQYINEFSRNFYDSAVKEKIKSINERHKQKAIKWCQKYNLPHIT